MLTFLHNAEIRTMCASMPRAEAAVIDGERFVFVGTETAASRFLEGRAHQKINAQSYTVVPGFHDAHLHFLHGITKDEHVALGNARSADEAVDILKAALTQHMGGWLIGEGWNQERFSAHRLLTREDLDKVSLDVPILATRVCGHLLTANSRAMEMAGCFAEDGVFREDGQDALFSCLPPEDTAKLLQKMKAAQTKLFAQGITSIQSDDLGSMPNDAAASFLRALRDAGDAGEMKVRYAEQALMGDLRSLRGFLESGLHRLEGKRLRISHIKLLADGSLGARTALLRKPYADAPGILGMATFTQEELFALVREAAAHGMPTAIHAIGDGAMETALCSFEKEGGALRNAVVHAQITDGAQIRRCGALGLTIMAQPIFLDADTPIVRQRVGDTLAQTSYSWRAMLGAGARVALSTDSPVEPFAVMPNLYCAVTRRGLRGGEPYLPHEALTLDEALYAYTAAGAFAMGEEAQKGRIAPGMLADFALLTKRLDDQTPEILLDTGVARTYIGGECVYAD